MVNKTILWIEDDIEIIAPVVTPLISLGFKIVECPNYAEALTYIKSSESFDLILLDLLLPPGKSNSQDDYLGLVFLRQLRQEFDVQTPVLVFSVIANSSEIGNELKLLKAMPLVKPIRPSQLKKVVMEMLNIPEE